MKRARASEVIEALKERGFHYSGKDADGWFTLTGELARNASEQGIRCEVALDPDFFALPRVRLLDIPKHFPAAVPHIGTYGDLCYIGPGSIVLNIFDPVGQTIACLDQADRVLSQITKGELVEDLVEEFFAYWNGPYCLFDVLGDIPGRQHCLIAEGDDGLHWFITDSVERTTKKIDLLGLKVTKSPPPTYRIKTTAMPRPNSRSWPPKTVNDILEWQSQLDRSCRRKIHERIQQGEREKRICILIFIDSPLLTYGFAVIYERSKVKVKLADRRDTTFGLKVLLLTAMRIDDQYLAQRNIPRMKTLAGKRVGLIGCGTIGGYLAEMLCKAGVGTVGGKLTLVDFDKLLPQNLGRHRLGFSHLLKNKAVAMVDELQRLAPGIEVEAIQTDARQVVLDDFDLLIDATGEESLGHWLCDTTPRTVPMISAWIEGPGTAVRAMIRTEDVSAGCYRCLWHGNRRGELRSVVGDVPLLLAGHGCEGLYVPFPASVSVQAASLAMDLVLDWVNGKSSPTLRTRVLDTTQTAAAADCDLQRDAECPICRS
ncbi:thiamine biosynthesis protein ThiF [Stenotrophomonas sp. MYb57]|uniref:ThiF family adenylyltransferase n=1 Tax=Stenotrophomonas sp. MYb57 TaxID=1827305 RepID=UPI000CF74B6C|nr:ThiF family adenylyltransferase [Stenotrophomonas sp. MYb57]AVJ32448.1 thiamine biosynthesis protein ThiF [Stenotrophomonas sp. MYb57]